MSLTKEDLVEIRKIFNDALFVHKCRFQVTDEEVKHLTGHFSQMKEIGDGDMVRGIHEMRENHLWLSKQRRFGDSLKKKIEITIVLGLVSGVLLALWEGLKHLVMGK